MSSIVRKILDIRIPRETSLSPDGRWLSHWERVTDWEHNVYRRVIIVTDLSRQTEAFRIDEPFCSAIKWTRDSRSMGFIGRRESRSVLRRVDADGSGSDLLCGEGRFTDFDWHPDSQRVVVIEEKPGPDSDIFAVEGEGTPSSLLVFDPTTGEKRRFGGWDGVYCISEPRWSPSGDRILFAALPEPDIREQRQYLWLLDPETGDLRRLIGDDRCIYNPVWDEEGARIAYSEREKAWHDLGGAQIKIMQLSDLSERVVVPHMEIYSPLLCWRKNEIILGGEPDGRSYEICAVDADSGECTYIRDDVSVLRSGLSGPQWGSGFSYISHAKDRLPEVMVQPSRDVDPISITDYRSQSQDWPQLPRRERISWSSTDGTRIQGVLVDARSNCSGNSYPLIVLLHGGPVVNVFESLVCLYFESWNPYPIVRWWESGVSVLMSDYRGSLGYGKAFKEAIIGRLGEFESADIISGIDHVIAEYGFDPSRIGVTGPSYGGYLTMLLATRSSERFAAASALCGFSDVRLHALTTDGNFDGALGDDPSGCLSPLMFVGSDSTPLLIQTGDSDTRVNPGHAHALHRLLKKHGVETRLIAYKGCGHIIDRPKQLLSAQEHNLEWFARWL